MTLSVLDMPFGCTSLVVGVTAGFLGLGAVALVAWEVTGNIAWVENFFRVPGALLLVSLAAVELLLSLRVLHDFSPGQPMRKAWRLISFSAGLNLAGNVAAHILSIRSFVNPLVHFAWWPDSATSIREFGLILGGTCRLALLAAGLYWALRVYRQSGFLARLARVDWILLAIVGAFVAREAGDVVVMLRHGAHPPPGVYLGWPVDPLLWLLLAEALLLNRSVRQMGQGWIGRCWKAFSTGILLVVLGDLFIWATGFGHLPWIWNTLGWYIWLPAAGAFALAPAYQLEAVGYAERARQVG